MRVRETTQKHYSHVVDWQQGGKRRRKFFANRDAADRWMRKHAAKLRFIPAGEPETTPEEFLAVLEARRHDVPLMDAIAHWRRTAGAAAGMTFSDLVKARLDAAEKGAIGKDYRKAIKLVLGLAEAKLGPLPAISITPSDLQSFIDSRGPGVDRMRHSRAILGSVFSHAVKKQWLQSNPIKGVTLPKAEYKEQVAVFTPEDAARWLQAVAKHRPAWLAAWAIKMFAGLRTAEVDRLEWRDVKLDRGFIQVTAGIAKTITRRLVDIQPNLAAILGPLAGKSRVCPPGVFWPSPFACMAYGGGKPARPAKNAARHSFVSYHLALFGDLHQTELQAGHDRKVLLRNYRELVTREEAAAYFSITAEASPLPSWRWQCPVCRGFVRSQRSGGERKCVICHPPNKKGVRKHYLPTEEPL